MTRDEVIRLAMEAGLLDKVDCSDDYFIPGDAFVEEIEAFAELVTEAEREKVAKWMIEKGYATGHGDTVEDLLKALEWQAKERARGFL
jgi:endonuclease YncB( thermonuclease family)